MIGHGLTPKYEKKFRIGDRLRKNALKLRREKDIKLFKKKPAK